VPLIDANRAITATIIAGEGRRRMTRRASETARFRPKSVNATPLRIQGG